MKTLMEHK
jgi:hypothetical protein